MPASRPFTLSLLTVGLAAVAHGAIFARLAEADPIVVSAVRTGVAALVMLPLGLATGWPAIRAGGTVVLARAGLGGLFLALHFAAWIASLGHTSIVNSVILVSLSPVWLAVYAVLVGRQRLGRLTLASILLSLIGTLVIALTGSGERGPTSGLFGDGLALLGGLCFAGYVLTGQRAMVTGQAHRLPLFAYLGLCYAAAALLLWTAVLGLGLPVAGLTGSTWAAMVGMGLVSQLIGHSSYNWALKRFSPRFVAVCLLAEPVVTTVLGYLYFGERVHPLVLAGGAVILAAIYLGARAERSRSPNA